MPELPEVERARASIERSALGRRIVAVNDTDTYVCRPHAPGEIARALLGRELTQACRRGKSMWLLASGDGPTLGLHLGMSGRIVIDGVADTARRLEDPRIPRQPDPVWDRFSITFAGGGSLVLRDPRRLGRVVLDPRIDRLGPDALDADRATFRSSVAKGTTALKARIMDQTVLAGVGNLLADETLWRAKLAPDRAAGSLSDDEADLLRRTLRAATRRAIDKGGVHTGDLIEHRQPGGHCPRCGGALQRATIGGRTTWWCPAEQQ